MQYIALLWTEKKGKLVQTFGPYPSEAAAQDAADKIADWPAIKDGQWEVVPLYPNPKPPVQQTTQSWAGGTITLHGNLYPTSQSTFTYTPQATWWNYTPGAAYQPTSVVVSGLTGEYTIHAELSR